MPLNKSSKGFAHLGLVLAIVLLVSVVAFGGWYVRQRDRDNTPSAYKITQAAHTPKAETPKQDASAAPTYTYPVDKWSEYKNKNLGFAFHYPKDWSEIDVRFDRDDFFMAVFNNPAGAWGPHNGVYQKASLDFRGHTASVGPQNHGDYAKGFYERDGKYYKVGDELSDDIELKDEDVLFAYDEGGVPTLLIKRLNYGGYEALELLVNISDRKIIGLNLMLIHPQKIDEYAWPAYSQSDIEIMKQVAASFRTL